MSHVELILLADLIERLVNRGDRKTVPVPGQHPEGRLVQARTASGLVSTDCQKGLASF